MNSTSPNYCKSCGKPAVATHAGSVTSYFFEHKYCQCQKAAIKKRVGAEVASGSICQNCGKAKPENKNAGSFTGYLFKELRCQCHGQSNKINAEHNFAPSVQRTTTAFRAKKRAPANRDTDSIGPGSVIGNVFKIKSLIGKGGMGVVYAAEHISLKKTFALKILSPELVDEQSWLRFKAEAQTVAALQHKSFVNVYDLGIHDQSLPFYSMDLLEGENLEELIAREGALEANKTVEIFSDVLEGMIYAHRNGIIHRDLKPANIFLCSVKRSFSKGFDIRILDFGISKLLKHDKQLQNLTVVGEIFGSPYYMSPEQCSGEQVDARSDIYALGCSMFETLTGYVPFEGESSTEIAMMHEEMPPPLLSDLLKGMAPDSPLCYVINRCLAKLPRERYQSAKELQIDLEQIKKGEPLSDSTLAYASSVNAGRQDRDLNEEKTKLLLPAVILTSLIVLGTACSVLFWQPKSNDENKSESNNKIETVSDTSRSSGSLLFSELSNNSLDSAANSPALARSRKDEVDTFLAKHPGDYGSIISKNGNLYKRLVFPQSFSIGQLDCVTAAKVVRYDARGNIDLTPETRLRFTADKVCAVYPALLKKFAPQDLRSLVTETTEQSASEIMSIISNFTALRILQFNQSELSSEELDKTAPLKNLSSLSFSHCKISGSALAKIKIIKQITHFSSNEITDVHPLLEALNQENLLSLRLENSELSETDFKLITKFENLEELDLANCNMTREKLAPLTKLKHLKALNISRNAKIDYNSIQLVTAFKNLETLWLPFELADESTEKVLRKALPKLKEIN